MMRSCCWRSSDMNVSTRSSIMFVHSYQSVNESALSMYIFWSRSMRTSWNVKLPCATCLPPVDATSFVGDLFSSAPEQKKKK